MFFHIHFVLLIITVLLQTCVNSNKDNKLKSTTIDAIVEKICNITLKSLADKTLEEKTLILASIEDKLKKSAVGSGVEGHKYVKFIMHGIKLIAYNNTKRIDPISGSVNLLNYQKGETTAEEKKAKEEAIHNIAVKIESLAKKYMKDAKTPESKQAVIETIKNKVINAANRRHMTIHDKHKEIKSYSNIIAKGIDLMIKKNIPNETRRIGFEENNTSNKGVRIKIMHAAISPRANNTNTEIPERSSCSKLLEEICSNTKTLTIFKCHYNKNILPLEKLCNEKPDCIDKSDEQDCAEQAIDKIKDAGYIMSQIERAMSRRCISPSLDKEILSKQNQVLRSVLQSQLRFIEKYNRPSIAELINTRRNAVNKNIIKKTTNEVALVVSSLAMALDGSLCARRFNYDNIDKMAMRYSGDTDADEVFDRIIRPTSTPMTACVCNGMFCANTTCPEACTRICWQKFGLNRWECQAVDGSPSVSLDCICDGKLDCFDETDESGCSLGSNMKFEAGKIYNDLLKLISTKTKSNEYQFILSSLLALYDSVKLIQKLSVKRDIEIMNIKVVREQCFSSINAIYEAFLSLHDVDKLNSGYAFLSSVSEQLMNAMKRSRTGNDRIISSDRCLCTGSRCALPRCSKMCTRACSVEANLTRYFCGDIKPNNHIPVNYLCNGKSNCPNGEDEDGCLKEVCRAHHLVVLRHKLKDIGLKHKGSALGEVLEAFKTKVTSTLMIAEKGGRPTPKEFRDIINNILRDVVMSYASLSYSRRNNNNNALKEFINISQIVMESIKSCGQ